MVYFSKRKWLVTLVVVVLSLGLMTGAAVAEDPTDSLFQRIRQVYNVVQVWHKDGADLQKFVDGAIKGGLEALGDPHTNYFPPTEYQGFLDSLNGSFSGIGAYLEQDGNYVVISSPIKGTPADKAGVRPGDRILEANGQNLVGATTEKAVQIIRGPAGTEVTLKIERPSENRTFVIKIKRAQITIPEVDSKMLDDKIGYIELASFGDDATAGFYKAVAELKGQGAKGLVLDLRRNGGGYLDAAVAIGSAFVPEGKAVVWQVGKNGKSPLPSDGNLIDLPVVVLVDGGSASASEILAGAIQDYGGKLVGTKSYGKGTVQQILGLEGGGGMKVTVAEYLTAKERHVDGIGLTPDYVVDAQLTPEQTQPLALTRPMRIGSSGSDVEALQRRLAYLGYKVDVDGFFGASTAKAVMEFNRANHLPEDPTVDLAFVEAFNRSLELQYGKLKNQDMQLDKALELIKGQVK